jgi:hypothetical protein
MGDKIWLNMQDLDDVAAGLTTTIDEFKNASSNNDRAEDAVGRPDDRSELRDKLNDFEDAWNDKREALTENLEGLLEQLNAVITGWRDFDKGVRDSLEEAGADNQPRPTNIPV